MARPSRGFSESIGIWKCWVLRRGENRSIQRKTSRSKEENQHLTTDSGNQTRATLVGGLHGRQMLNHCAVPAPLQYIAVKNGIINQTDLNTLLIQENKRYKEG